MLNKKEDLISFKMFGEQALKKLAIIRGDMCKLYSNTETWSRFVGGGDCVPDHPGNNIERSAVGNINPHPQFTFHP
jgi:hypothetical protein